VDGVGIETFRVKSKLDPRTAHLIKEASEGLFVRIIP